MYAIALTIGTHWPKLRVEGPVPSSDKIVHFLAFGGLAFLLWRTRWIAKVWVMGAIALAWTAMDEITQAMPGLGRTASLADVVAGAAGVVVAMTIAGWVERRAAAQVKTRR